MKKLYTFAIGMSLAVISIPSFANNSNWVAPPNPFAVPPTNDSFKNWFNGMMYREYENNCTKNYNAWRYCTAKNVRPLR